MSEKELKTTEIKKKDSSDEFLDLVKTAIWAAVLALLIRTFAYEPFNIPSGSMIPNLLVGDYLFVSKYSYGYGQYSFPFGIANFEGRIWNKEPQRGDVAVFRQPTNTSIDYIKRIVGLPGDTVQVKDGILFINGEPLKRERLSQNPFAETDIGLYSYTTYREIIDEKKSYTIIEVGDEELYDNTDIFTVPPEYFFAMGDNRDNSMDSRAMNHVGFIPRENLIGRAEIIFFSTKGKAALHEFWKWPQTIRYDRLLKRIE